MKKLLFTICLLFGSCFLFSAQKNEVFTNEYYVTNSINPDIRKMYDNLRDYPYLIIQTVNSSDTSLEFFNETIQLGYTTRISFFDWDNGKIYEFYDMGEGFDNKRYYRVVVISFENEKVTKIKSLGTYYFYEYSDGYSSWKVYNLALDSYNNLFCKNLSCSYDDLDKEKKFCIYTAFYPEDVWPFDYEDEEDWNYVESTQKTVLKDNGYVITNYRGDNEMDIDNEIIRSFLDNYHFSEQIINYGSYISVIKANSEIDKNGNIIKYDFSFEDETDSQSHIINFKYKYDSKNNWITMDDSVSKVERQIYYDKKTAPIIFETFIKENGFFDYYFDELPDNFTQADYYSLIAENEPIEYALEHLYISYDLGNKDAHKRIITILKNVEKTTIIKDVQNNWEKQSQEKYLPQLLKDLEEIKK